MNNRTYRTQAEIGFILVMFPVYMIIAFSVGHIGRGGILNCVLMIGAFVLGARIIVLNQRLEVEKIAKCVGETQFVGPATKVCVCGHTQAVHSPCSPMGCEAPGCDCHRTTIEQRRA